MSTEAQLLVIVQYDPSIKNYLEYPNDWYDSVPIGKLVASTVGKETVSRSATERFAGALCCEAFNLATHLLNPSKFDFKSLEEFFSKEELDGIRLLIRLNAVFFFRLNT